MHPLVWVGKVAHGVLAMLREARRDAVRYLMDGMDDMDGMDRATARVAHIASVKTSRGGRAHPPLRLWKHPRGQSAPTLAPLKTSEGQSAPTLMPREASEGIERTHPCASESFVSLCAPLLGGLGKPLHFACNRKGGGAGVGGFEDGAADDEVCGTVADGLGGGRHALLVADIRTGRAYPGGD